MTNPDKIKALHAIRDIYPGISSTAQCARILEALAQFSINTFEAMRHLDAYYAPARVMTLRRQGHDIATHWQTIVTEAGERHRIGVYTLRQAAKLEAAP